MGDFFYEEEMRSSSCCARFPDCFMASVSLKVLDFGGIILA